MYTLHILMSDVAKIANSIHIAKPPLPNKPWWADLDYSDTAEIRLIFLTVSSGLYNFGHRSQNLIFLPNAVDIAQHISNA